MFGVRLRVLVEVAVREVLQRVEVQEVARVVQAQKVLEVSAGNQTRPG